MRKVCKKDKVIVISGRYKGSTGIVLKVLEKGEKVLVEGVNKVMKSNKGAEGGENYISKEAPIHISNVALVGDDGKPIKVGFSFNKDKIKIRVNKKTGEEIPRNN